MIIYKITNKITNVSYIGQTIESLKERWAHHCDPKSNCIYISRAIKKYGKDNFILKVLCKCDSLEEMNYREQYYIRLFNTLMPNGYNLDSGGNNKRHHEETKLKISASHKGKIHKPMSIECKAKISASKIGKYGVNNGKSFSQAHKDKISIAMKAYQANRLKDKV